jgi:hypothetical protein
MGTRASQVSGAFHASLPRDLASGVVGWPGGGRGSFGLRLRGEVGTLRYQACFGEGAVPSAVS